MDLWHIAVYAKEAEEALSFYQEDTGKGHDAKYGDKRRCNQISHDACQDIRLHFFTHLLNPNKDEN
jgi:hypothetical protein